MLLFLCPVQQLNDNKQGERWSEDNHKETLKFEPPNTRNLRVVGHAGVVDEAAATAGPGGQFAGAGVPQGLDDGRLPWSKGSALRRQERPFAAETTEEDAHWTAGPDPAWNMHQ